MDTSLVPLILTTLVFSFFFAGIEIAFLSANKLQIELQGKQGKTWGVIMSKFLKDPSTFIGTTLIGNTVALVLFGIFMAQFIDPLLYFLPENYEDEEIELDKKIFHNALEFKTVKVRDCMIPRMEIASVGIDEGITALKNAFVESGHSKILIYKETIDDLIGYCHSAALFKKPLRIEEIMTPVIITQETAMANELMVQLIKERKSIAVVVDEFGGTSGMVSMEDLMEEIFGEIEDEHDSDDLVEMKVDERTFVFSARLEVDYLNDNFGLNLPLGEYETLGGLILAYTEDFPKQGDTVTILPFTFVILKTDKKRIDTIKVVWDKDNGLH